MTALRHLRLVAFLEGLSFVVLLFIAMPLKHLAAMPLPVRVVGSLHGLLFLVFLVTLFRAAKGRGWPLRRTALGLLASVVPFGTFVFDRVLRAEITKVDRGGGEQV
jgi:integral membrane protein